MSKTIPKKKIAITDHALKRMAERGINKKDIYRALGEGKVIKGNAIEHWSAIEYSGLTVVYQEKNTEVVIITVYERDQDLEAEIKKIPLPNEWWKDDNYQTFVNCGNFLLSKGLSTEEILGIMEQLFKATCREFGE